MDHLKVDLGPPPVGRGVEEDQIPFFGSRSRRTETTCVTFVFVLINIGAFLVMMVVNDCESNSHGDCSMKFLKRVAFQPLSENPLLGPGASTLLKLGALHWTLIFAENQKWRLFTCIWLHAGLIHLILSLVSVVFVGIRLEKAFGPWRVGIIYLLSSFLGSLLSSTFVRFTPAVGSSGALFGLIGALVSDLIRNWHIYYNKFGALLLLSLIFIANFLLGLLPMVDNASNIAGFCSGILLGFTLLYNPLLGNSRKGLYEFGLKKSVEIKVKLDKPKLRIISLSIFVVVFAGCVLAVLFGVNGNKYCPFCRYIECIPTKRWSCMQRKAECEEVVQGGRLTLSCIFNDHFRIFPFADISKARADDLCSQICNSHV